MADIANHAVTESHVSLDFASKWYDRAGFTLIGGTVLVLVSTAAIVWLGIEKEHHWDLLRQRSNEKVAGLEAETAKANAELGKANEAIATANAAAEKDRNERLKLEAEIAPRRLTPNERTSLVDSAKQFAGRHVTVQSYVSDAESTVFGGEIADALREAGLSFGLNLGVEVPEPNNLIFGILVRGPRDDKFGLALAEMFRRHHLGNSVHDVNVRAQSSLSYRAIPPTENDVTVFIGLKPLREPR